MPLIGNKDSCFFCSQTSVRKILKQQTFHSSRPYGFRIRSHIAGRTDWICSSTTSSGMPLSFRSSLRTHLTAIQLLDTGEEWSLIKLLEDSMPMRLGPKTNPVSTDIGILCSTCMTTGFLTSIYQRGRGEKLHAPLFVATILGSFMMWKTRNVQMDILALTSFQWMLALAMLISRCYDFTVFTHDAAEHEILASECS